MIIDLCNATSDLPRFTFRDLDPILDDNLYSWTYNQLIITIKLIRRRSPNTVFLCSTSLDLGSIAEPFSDSDPSEVSYLAIIDHHCFSETQTKYLEIYCCKV